MPGGKDPGMGKRGTGVRMPGGRVRGIAEFRRWRCLRCVVEHSLGTGGRRDFTGNRISRSGGTFSSE